MNMDRTRFANPEMTGNCIFHDILLKDVSGSMNGKGFEPNKSKRDLMYEASLAALAIKRDQRPLDRLAVIAYGTTAKIFCGLENVVDGYEPLCCALKKAKDMCGGGTRMAGGLRIALDLIDERDLGLSDVYKPIVTRLICYSDGHDEKTAPALECAGFLKERGVIILSFGVAQTRQEVDEQFLRQIATTPDHYRFLGDGDEIRRTFARIATGMLSVDS